MAAENKKSKGFVGEGKQVEAVELKAQEAHARVYEIKTLLTMLELMHTEASSGNEVDQVAVLDVIARCADQAMLELEEIQRITGGC